MKREKEKAEIRWVVRWHVRRERKDKNGKLTYHLSVNRLHEREWNYNVILRDTLLLYEKKRKELVGDVIVSKTFVLEIIYRFNQSFDAHHGHLTTAVGPYCWLLRAERTSRRHWPNTTLMWSWGERRIKLTDSRPVSGHIGHCVPHPPRPRPRPHPNSNTPITFDHHIEMVPQTQTRRSHSVSVRLRPAQTSNKGRWSLCFNHFSNSTLALSKTRAIW